MIEFRVNDSHPHVMIDNYMGGDHLLVIQYEVDAGREFVSIRCDKVNKAGYSYLSDPECRLEYAGCGINESNLSAEAFCLELDNGAHRCSTSPEFLLGYRNLVFNPPRECQWSLRDVRITTKGLELFFYDSESKTIESIRLTRPLFYNRDEYFQVDVPNKTPVEIPNIVDIMGWQVQKLCFRISAPDANSTLISVAYPHEAYEEEYFLPVLRLVKALDGGPHIIKRYYRLDDISKNPECLTELLPMRNECCYW